MNGIKKLLFIGGHHNSAIATIDWLKTRDDVKFFWIGKKYIGQNTLTPEFSDVSARNIPFFNITAGKLYRAGSITYIPHIIYNLLLVPIGFFQAFHYLQKIKPDLIISFGGYMAVPIIIIGKMMGIKSVLHEQTGVIGLANRISSKFVEKIYTSWPEDFYLNEKEEIKKKIVYTGLPISEEKIAKAEHTAEKYIFPREAKTIYITGGKSGSLFFNKSFIEILDSITDKFNLIWSTGRRIGDYDYNQILSAVAKLPIEKTEYVVVQEYFSEKEVLKILNTADVVVTRAGGHTIYELALLKKPAIVIPIPWTTNDEQLKNAKILEEFGLAKILNQEETTPYKILETIENFVPQTDRIKDEVRDKEFVSSKGQENLSNEILKLLEP